MKTRENNSANKSGMKWFLVVIIASLLAWTALLAEASDEHQLFQKMSDAWTTVNTRFYHPGTSQYYTAEPSLLPSPAQIQNLDPDDCGYGTGMDDVPLFASTLLVSICDQYDVTQNDSLRADAAKVFDGLELCATAHGIPGFIARGVSPEDGESIYICSSRDQYTNLVHGIWRYYHSPLSDEAAKSSIRGILHDVAERMTRNVIPANNYDFLRADGSRDTRGICRMWNVYCHEMARLPMIYAAAWDVGQNQEHYDFYRQYLSEAIQDSLALPSLPPQETSWRIPPYSVLQMQNSLEVLNAMEQDPGMQSQIRQAMLQVAEFTETKLHTTHRQTAELAIAQLMSEDYVFTEQHKSKLTEAIMGANYDADPEAAYVLQGAYWKAVKNGEIAQAETAEGLLIEESFDYAPASWEWDGDYENPVIQSGLGGGTGFVDDSQWGICLQANTTTGTVSIVDGLTFNGLHTSGNALFTQNFDNSALVSRAIGVTVERGATVWTSYLWSHTNTPSSGWAYSHLTDSQFGTTNRRLRILRNETAAGTRCIISDGADQPEFTLSGLQDGDTYLMIAKNTNMGQEGTGTLWVMSESDYAACAADGVITEQELDDHCLGRITGTLASNTMISGAFLQLANVWGAGTFDEFRIGTTLADVTPAMPAGLPGDLNDDGFVGGDDLDIVRSFWGQSVTAGDLLAGDPSGDGFVGGDDLDIVRANWGQGAPSAPTAVPEPGVAVSLLAALCFSAIAYCARGAGIEARQ